MTGDRRWRQIASLLAIFVAGLATIATSIPYGLVTFESAGHVWISDGQPGSVDVHVEVDASQASEIRTITLRVSSGISEDVPYPLEAGLASAPGDVAGDWQPAPASWTLDDPGCVSREPCVRDFRIEIRSTAAMTQPLLVPWRVYASLSIVESYDLVDVTIGPSTPTPAPGALGILSASAAAALTMLLVALASWRTKRPERVLWVAEIVVGVLLTVVGTGLFAIDLPGVSGGALLLVVLGLGIWALTRRSGLPTDSPRAGLLVICLPATALLLTAHQIAPSAAPLEIVIAHVAIGSALGVAIAGFARPCWWRSRLTTTRDRLAALSAVGLALMLTIAALFAGSTAVTRDVVPVVLTALAIWVLLALREWAQKPSIALSVVGIVIAVLALVGAVLIDRIGGGNFFVSVARPAQIDPLVFPIAVAAVAAIVAFVGRKRVSDSPDVTADQADGVVPA